MKNKIKKSTLIPSVLLIYLAITSYFGYEYYKAGAKLFYLSVIIGTLFVILLLHFSLKRKEKLQSEREKEMNKNNNH